MMEGMLSPSSISCFEGETVSILLTSLEKVYKAVMSPGAIQSRDEAY